MNSTCLSFKKDKEDAIREAYTLPDDHDDWETKHDEMAEIMAGLLMNAGTYLMFEDIANAYLDGSEEYREGLDFCFKTITGKHLDEVAKDISAQDKEREEEVER